MKTNNVVKQSLCLLLIVLTFMFCLAGCVAPCSHKYGEWTVVEEPTCQETGLEKRECDLCGMEETKDIPAGEHSMLEDDGDCTTPVLCEVCSEVLIEANESHIGGEATCTEKAKCTECGLEYGQYLDHLDEVIWVQHPNTHYQVYACCFKQITEEEAHNILDGECTECGFKPTISISSVDSKPGNKSVKVVISVKDNPGIIGISMNVQFDDNVLNLIEVENGEALDTLIFTEPSELKNNCTFLWDGIEIKDQDIKDGEVLILVFEVLEDAPLGDYNILLKISAYDNELNALTLFIEGGKISINN